MFDDVVKCDKCLSRVKHDNLVQSESESPAAEQRDFPR